MPRFAANLSTLFTELPFLARFGAAAEAEFLGCEIQFPYAIAKAHIAEELQAHALTLVLFNLPPGDWESGERGIACHPDRVQEFRDGVGTAIDYAHATGCGMINCLTGIAPIGAGLYAAYETLVENLRFAAEKLKEEEILLVAEPINTHDIPGYFLNSSAQAIALFNDVGSGNLRLQYDIYHMQRMEGELASTIKRLLPRIGHIQLADSPGRHEPGTGEINFPWLLRFIDRIGYSGWIGCEYHPARGTAAGLSWMEDID
jgi:hydroxypyruvate isomerase